MAIATASSAHIGFVCARFRVASGTRNTKTVNGRNASPAFSGENPSTS